MRQLQSEQLRQHRRSSGGTVGLDAQSVRAPSTQFLGHGGGEPFGVTGLGVLDAGAGAVAFQPVAHVHILLRALVQVCAGGAARPSSRAPSEGAVLITNSLSSRLTMTGSRRWGACPLPSATTSRPRVHSASRSPLRHGRIRSWRPSSTSVGQRRRRHSSSMTVGTIITFRHPILRSVVYDSAAEGLRRTVHLAVAEELTAASERDRQIWHLAAGATHLDEDLAGQLDDLGRRAALRAASTVASTAFERAARWSPTSAAARSRLVAAAGAAWDGGQRERALTLLDEAEPAEGAMTPSGSRLRARIVTRSGSLREGLVLLERAAEVAGPDDRVRLLAEACHACMYLADMRSLRRIELQLSTSLSQAAESDARGVGMVASGAALVLLGEDGTPRLRAALPLLADRSTVPWSMLALLFLRDTEHGGELRRLVDDARTHVGVGALPSLLFHLARDQATARSWERAEANYDESARLARETGQGAELAMSLAGRACLESRRGRDDTWRIGSTRSLITP